MKSQGLLAVLFVACAFAMGCAAEPTTASDPTTTDGIVLDSARRPVTSSTVAASLPTTSTTTPRATTTTAAPTTSVAPTTTAGPTTTTSTTTTTVAPTTTTSTTTTTTVPEAAGAALPIQWSGTPGGAALWVSTIGNDANAGTPAAPLRSVATAIARLTTGGTVVVRGGTYFEGGLNIPRGRDIDIVAAPGEIPVFDGSQAVTAAWSSDGTTSWTPYTPTGSPFGSGLYDTGGFADPAAPWSDQVWVGSARLKQVLTLAGVAPGRFYVDTTNNRIHLAPSDAAGNVRVSVQRRFLTVSGSGSSLRGIRVARFSANLADSGVIRIEGQTLATTPLTDVVIEDVEISDAANQAVQVFSTETTGYPRALEDILNDITLRRVTISGANWMGVAANWVDRLLLDHVRITGSNAAGEYRFSPQSGALKTSRTRDVTVADSVIADNNSHGLWFDQSNVDMTVARSSITNNVGAGVFFEISDGLTMVDNLVVAPSNGTSNAVKLAGSSGIRMVNNTVIGGRDPVGVYVDNRSMPGCADPSQPLCASSYGSDRDGVRPRPSTLDWMPRIDLMVNNVIGFPTASGYCGGTAALCVTAANGSATASPQSVFHQADPARGIPATVVDGNVYVNPGGPVVRTSAGSPTDAAGWSTLLRSSPFWLPGSELAGRSGAGLVNADGSPTATLTSLDGTAAPAPTDAGVNAWVPAGTRHFGRF